MKDHIDSSQNEIKFLREELKVKNHPLELTNTSKIITFSRHLKSENKVFSGIVPRGDFCKEKAEAVNRLLKDNVLKKICILFVLVTLVLSRT